MQKAKYIKTTPLHEYKIIIFLYNINFIILDRSLPSMKKYISDSFFNIYIIQDEYRCTDVKGKILKDLNVKLAFVNMNEKDAKVVFKNNNTLFKNVLTGQVPNIDYKIIQIKDRKIDIFYRATPLPYIYGELGQEKVNIGKKMKKYGIENNLNVDIEWTYEKKIFEEEWYKKLGNSKTTLATYSGSEVFDQEPRNTEIENKLKKNPNYTYEEAKKDFKIEPMFEACQVSPKMFEACTLKTVLIMYEGKYKDIFRPNIHYIELKKDHSNMDDVKKKIKDDKYLQDMANRAYNDIIKSGKYSYESFIKYFDSVVKKEYEK